MLLTFRLFLCADQNDKIFQSVTGKLSRSCDSDLPDAVWHILYVFMPYPPLLIL